MQYSKFGVDLMEIWKSIFTLLFLSLCKEAKKSWKDFMVQKAFLDSTLSFDYITEPIELLGKHLHILSK